MIVVDGFGNVAVDDQGFAFVEVFNMSDALVSVSDIQIDSLQDISVEYEDCTNSAIAAYEACYIELQWTPSGEESIDADLSLNASAGGQSETLTTPLVGVSQSLAEFGDTVEYPDAQFETDHAWLWEFDYDDNDDGDTAVGTEFGSDDEFWLSGFFNNVEAIDLFFLYQLDGANAVIFIDDVAVYELSHAKKWDEATITVPAGATVRWQFKSITQGRKRGSVRMNGFTQAAASVKQIDASTDSPSSALAAQPQLADMVGAGANGIMGSFVIMLLLAMRRWRKAPVSVQP